MKFCDCMIVEGAEYCLLMKSVQSEEEEESIWRIYWADTMKWYNGEDQNWPVAVIPSSTPFLLQSLSPAHRKTATHPPTKRRHCDHATKQLYWE